VAVVQQHQVNRQHGAQMGNHHLPILVWVFLKAYMVAVVASMVHLQTLVCRAVLLEAQGAVVRDHQRMVLHLCRLLKVMLAEITLLKMVLVQAVVVAVQVVPAVTQDLILVDPAEQAKHLV
jgi:hypothetical protein